jgi:hypothetical protein
VTYPTGGEYPSSVAVADVNHDAKPDLVATNGCASLGSNGCAGEDGLLAVLLGNGYGAFQPPLTYDSAGAQTNLDYSVTVADVNGDGNADLLVANSGDDTVGVLLGNGDGTFKVAVTYPSGGSAPVSTVVADVNGDGKLDLLVVNSCSDCVTDAGSVAVLLGNGDGTFQAAVPYGSLGYAPRAVAVADVNGDGKPDIVVANNCVNYLCSNSSGSVAVLLGNGNGTFQAAVAYDSGTSYANSVTVADVNGDGKLDLLVANSCGTGSNCTNGTVGALLGNGNGTFQAAVTYNSGGYGAGSVAVADVNGDGKPDVVVSNQCASSSNCTNGTVGVCWAMATEPFRRR